MGTLDGTQTTDLVAKGHIKRRQIGRTTVRRCPSLATLALATHALTKKTAVEVVHA